jgi:PD-(D/E)XK nuclease superfamily
MRENEIGTIIVDCAVELHRDLGPGLLETVYELTLARALELRGLHVNGRLASLSSIRVLPRASREGVSPFIIAIREEARPEWVLRRIAH